LHRFISSDGGHNMASEVAAGVDGICADAEQFGNLSADITGAASNGSPDPTSQHTQPSC
jgi:hypothetical protein